jgi:hypothetical protein
LPVKIYALRNEGNLFILDGLTDDTRCDVVPVISSSSPDGSHRWQVLGGFEFNEGTGERDARFEFAAECDLLLDELGGLNNDLVVMAVAICVKASNCKWCNRRKKSVVFVTI